MKKGKLIKNKMQIELLIYVGIVILIKQIVNMNCL